MKAPNPKNRATKATPSIAILYPGNRVEKMLRPLEHSSLDVAVEPNDAYDRDFVIADNADRDLGKEVLKKPLTNAELIYRMRGDVYHELDLWDMFGPKQWIAENVVLANLDGVIAVSQRLGERFEYHNPKPTIGHAGLVKEPKNWPTVTHTAHELRAVTLTNANYEKKVQPLIDKMGAVESVLEETGGYWHICGDGRHTDELETHATNYDHITFEGYVDAKDELAQANIMLHFSLLDGQPNSVLEGMASRLPVITNDFSAFRQFGGPITIAQSHDLAKWLKRYQDPDTRAHAGVENEQYIRQKHILDAIARQYERYFYNYEQ